MTDEATAPEEGITEDTANEEQAVDSVNEDTQEDTQEAQHALLGGDDPMLKVPDKFLNEDGTPDYDKLTKSYNNLERMKGPVSAAPETIEGYSMPEELTQKMDKAFLDYSDESMTDLRTEAKELGISNDQLNFFLEKNAETLSQFFPTPDVLETELKEVWGDSFASNITAASEVLETLGSSLSKDEIVGNLPLIKFAAMVASEMKQDTPDIKPAVEGEGTEAELDKLMGSPEYYVKDSDTRKRADELLNKLYS